MSGDGWEKIAIRVWTTTAGLRAAVAVSPMDSVNGYVRLSHPPAEYAMDDIEAHGSITFGPDEDGWIGFDTGHAGDRWERSEIDRLVDLTPEPWQSQVRHHIEMLRKVQDEMKAELGYPDWSRHPWGLDWTMEALVFEVESLARSVVRAYRGADA